MTRDETGGPQGSRPTGDARRIALDIIKQVLAANARAFAQDLLEQRLDDLDEPDRRLATYLTYGVIRRLATLDAVIRAYSSRALAEIDAVVHLILRLGIYQLLYCERIPQHAAVDQSVALVRTAGKPGAAGFVNAVLRTVTRELAFSGKPEADKPRESFALGSGRACRFARTILPPPGDQVAFLAALHSYPAWLVERWLLRYGDSWATELFALCNEPAPFFIRPNSVLNLPGVLLDTLAEEGVEATLSPGSRTLCLPPHTRVDRLQSFREGRFQVQDDSNAAVARFLRPRPGEHVLDLCAAPGGKTCHLAELMRNDGHITAVDLSESRLAHVKQNALRMAHPIITTVVGDGAEAALQNEGAFERVLVDAPCSNTGVLRRRVEVRWRLSDAIIASLAAKQQLLLKAALRALKPGGHLVYSTCSLEPEENGKQVCAVLAEVQEFRLDAEQQLTPSRDGGDGIYMARIIRRGPPPAEEAR
jgi:16S rRNA (cytosine967-C5)-methyltransferase